MTLANRVVLAPMAGLTTSPYRRHMKAHGVGLVFTEMVSAQGLIHGNARTRDYLDFKEEERPLAVQLFGSTPAALARSAEMVLQRKTAPDFLDINMGCPVRKVVKTGAGSALLGDAERATAVAAAVVAVASQRKVPVTVKLRSGLRPGDGLALGLAPRLQEAGVAALAFHPRAASEYYSGKADHTVTSAVAGCVSIPVVASGDVDSLGEAEGIMESTGAAAVMVARGCSGDPWLVDSLLCGEPVPRPSVAQVVEELRRLLGMAAEERGEERAARWIRKLLTWYLRPSGVESVTIEDLRSLATAHEVDVGLARLAEAGDC